VRRKFRGLCAAVDLLDRAFKNLRMDITKVLYLFNGHSLVYKRLLRLGDFFCRNAFKRFRELALYLFYGLSLMELSQNFLYGFNPELPVIIQ
jgi:hypothetical protein